MSLSYRNFDAKNGLGSLDSAGGTIPKKELLSY